MQYIVCTVGCFRILHVSLLLGLRMRSGDRAILFLGLSHYYPSRPVS